jgi:hypothetical protein
MLAMTVTIRPNSLLDGDFESTFFYKTAAETLDFPPYTKYNQLYAFNHSFRFKCLFKQSLI